MPKRQSTFVRLLKEGDQFVEYGDMTYRVWKVAEGAKVIHDKVQLKVQGLRGYVTYNLDDRVRLYHE